MTDHDRQTTRKDFEPFTVGDFRPEDAEGLVRLFLAVYGEGYPIRLFYDPGAITAANREGRYHSIVARTEAGEVIGATHIYRSAPCKSLYEAGAGLVRKDFRNSGATIRLMDYLFTEFVPRNPHIEEIFGEAVCNHPYMQKTIGRFHYTETAIEVALMPAAAYTSEKSAQGRVATLNAFRCYKPKPQRIFLPLVYEQELRRIYRRLDDARDAVLSEGGLPDDIPTRADLTIFDFAQVARIAVPRIGNDFLERLCALEGEALAKNTVVLQAWLNLTDPWVGRAVDILRERGYFFGGPMPRWFDGDGLLMQRLHCPPDFDGIILESEFARQILEFIREDWGRVGS